MTQAQPFLSAFERLEQKLGAQDGPELRAVRKTAIDRFAALGFPTARQEAWKYTSLAPLAGIPFSPAFEQPPEWVSPAALRRLPFGDLPLTRLVFMDGRFVQPISTLRYLPESATVQSLAAGGAEAARAQLARHARYEENPLVALNTAFLDDGALISLPQGLEVEAPIHLLFLSTGREVTACHPRVLVVAGPGSRATVIESYAGLGDKAYFTNAVTELVLGEGARLQHLKVQEEAPSAFHLATVQVRQERGSAFSSHFVSLGGALVRNELNVSLQGEGAECSLDGLCLAFGAQHVDAQTFIDHAVPRCSSRELYKGAFGGRSSGVFNGRVIVREGAQKSDARQSNRNLLLSAEAEVNAKPQLEIYADDVQCSHGATVGQLDEEALFYLRSRGVGREHARRMLTQAFAVEALSRILPVALRDRVEQSVSSWLEQRLEVTE